MRSRDHTALKWATGSIRERMSTWYVARSLGAHRLCYCRPLQAQDPCRPSWEEGNHGSMWDTPQKPGELGAETSWEPGQEPRASGPGGPQPSSSVCTSPLGAESQGWVRLVPVMAHAYRSSFCCKDPVASHVGEHSIEMCSHTRTYPEEERNSPNGSPDPGH